MGRKDPKKIVVGFREIYVAHGAEIAKDELPELNHTQGKQPDRADIIGAGHMEIDGHPFEFQDIRVYFER